MLALGIGGVAVEAMRDVAFRLLPVTGEDVGDMIDELRAKAVLGAFRGAALRDGCASSSRRRPVEFWPALQDRISDIEINPMTVGAKARASSP